MPSVGRGRPLLSKGLAARKACEQVSGVTAPTLRKAVTRARAQDQPMWVRERQAPGRGRGWREDKGWDSPGRTPSWWGTRPGKKGPSCQQCL